MKEESFFSFTPDRETITRSAGQGFLIQMIVKMKGIITMPILSYFLLPNEMGLFNFVVVAAAMALPFFMLNLPDGSQVFFAQEKSEKKIKNMYMTVINSVIINVLFLTSALMLFMALFKPQFPVSPVWILLFLYVQIVYKIPEFILITFQKTSILLRHSFVKDLGASLFSIVLVIIGYSYKGMLFGHAFFILMVGILLLRKVFQNVSYSFTISVSYLKSFLKMSIPLFPVFFFAWVIRSSDTFFLIYFQGEGVLGKYSVVCGISNVIMVLTYALYIFWFPVSAKLWLEDREKYKKAYKLIFAAFLTVLCTVILLFELNSKIIMKILVRNSVYHDAYIIFGIMAFSFSMQVFVTLLTAPLYSNKNPTMILISYLAGGILNAVLNFSLIPIYGLLGAAVSTAISYLAIIIIMSYLNYRIAKFSFLDKRLYYIVPIFTGLWIIAVYFREKFRDFQILLTDVVMLGLIGTVLFFKILSQEEKSYISSAIKGIDFKKQRKP